MGSLLYECKTPKFKKGATLKSMDELWGDGKVYVDMPEGVKSITYKVTFTNTKKQKNILKVQTTEDGEELKGFNKGEH